VKRKEKGKRGEERKRDRVRMLYTRANKPQIAFLLPPPPLPSFHAPTRENRKERGQGAKMREWKQRRKKGYKKNNKNR
jgi:hypothetical protein